MELYQLTKENLENTADEIKVVILSALVSGGYITLDAAEVWCENHTVILRKKRFFRTWSTRWRKEKEDGLVYIVVKKV